MLLWVPTVNTLVVMMHAPLESVPVPLWQNQHKCGPSPLFYLCSICENLWLNFPLFIWGFRFPLKVQGSGLNPAGRFGFAYYRVKPYY